ncbi:hypothetical protein BXZ70DRAFT_1077729 [Cristinia sonorae]|uniref:Uncharacterized protein n=1 Tax=Cristinia sonorae TaxID=1940300 RepID=A0A8K0UN70_9AGAR|nr:hypothetical protein BXZ70DRAFT_1077729 [Cristinia sonorae]
MPRTLRELLREPFGPYVDSEVLADNLKSTRTRMLDLHQVFLSCQGQPTGLTKCEHCQPEFTTNNRRVEIEGVLIIKKLAWLSPEGLELIQDDLRARDGPSSTFTLRNLFGRASPNEPPGLKIRIKAVKNMAAVYLHSSKLPHGLFLQTENRYRNYQVVSMDPVTYKHSYLYLSRYRTLRVLKDVVRYDSERSGTPTPREERTPKWFAAMHRKLLRREKPIPEMIYLSSDSEGSEAEDDRKVLRHVYHRSRAEMLLLFARHVEWLIDDQSNRRKGDRYIDVGVWQEWERMVRRVRSRAQGDDDTLLAHFADEDEDDADDEGEDEDGGPSDGDGDDVGQQMQVDRNQAPYGGTPPPPRRVSSVVLGKRKATLPRRSTTLVSQRGSASPRTPSPSYSPSPRYTTPPRVYDDDFSQSSDSNWSDSSASLPSRPPTPPSPTLLRRIPYIILHKPAMPKYAYKWDCPIAKCTYTADLLRPTDGEWGDIPAYGKRRFERYDWTLDDPWVKQWFYRVVSRHWKEHLSNEGIDVVMEDKGVKFEWMDEKSGEGRKKASKPAVKVEQEH